MTTEQFITVRETSQLLGISEKKVMDMIESQKLQAYRIADQFLRLKKSEVVGLRNTDNIVNENVKFEYTKAERIADFFYFNDFYLIAMVAILALMGFILLM